MLKLILLTLVASASVSYAETAADVTRAYNSIRTNGEIVDAIAMSVPEKDQAAVRAFFSDRKLKLDAKPVRAQVKDGEIRFTTADGLVVRSRVIDPLKGQYRLSGVDLDLDRRRPVLERLAQIESSLSRKETRIQTILIPKANAYAIGVIGSLIIGAYYLYEKYQQDSQLRTLIWANNELKMAKNECDTQLKKVITVVSDRPYSSRSQVRSPELVAARQSIGKMSSYYICRNAPDQKGSREQEQMAEGCIIIDKLNSCIQELAAKTEVMSPRVANIATHSGEAVKYVNWRANDLATIKGSAQQASSSQ